LGGESVSVLASCTVDSGLESWSGGESVSVLASCTVDSGLESWSGHTKHYKSRYLLFLYQSTTH
jgi:hypothetical protein